MIWLSPIGAGQMVSQLSRQPMADSRPLLLVQDGTGL
jgi:hypothetical protein